MSKKQKNILLILGFILALVICYQFAISKTLQQKKEFKILSQEELLFENAPKQLLLLKQKEVYFDSFLIKYQLDGSSIQNNLLKTINSLAKDTNLKVVSFLEPHIIIKNDLTINTYEFIVEGSYNEINQLIYRLEQQSKFGEIINLHFEKKKNFRSRKYYLEASVLLRNFG
ncbi:hypothetical protein [Olleya sp.]|jgi:diaminopimelate epimerase|uniref:hypothetical protein n=1 Tax=Olleya sp. TaxID=1906788 RepID=UPI0032D8E900